MGHRGRLSLIGIALAVFLVLWVGPRLALRRSTVERFLETYFAGQVHIEAFDVSLFPLPRATATRVVLRRHGRMDVPPIVTFERVEMRASVLGLLRSPRHLASVRIDGLVIRVPAGRPDNDKGADRGGGDRSPLVVDRLLADNARLELLPDEPNKRPVIFDLRHLDARSIATDRALTFETELVNPKPRGLIAAKGTFGPFDRREAGLTPVSGTFTYRNVDLGTIHGIGGHLSAEGDFGGRLRSITVRGRTHTPDFSIDVARQPVPLETTFDARVDGTNGNTYLDRVEARLADTPIVASGAVVDEPDPASRAVVLKVRIEGGRLQDVLRLAMRTVPPLTGGLQLTTRFRLPGDERAVSDRLELEGHFLVERADLTSDEARSKLGELSGRAQGKPESPPDAHTRFDVRGAFRLDQGVLRFPDLEGTLPGASIRLQGTYTLRSEAIDMRGTLRMAAKVSETTSGWKSWLLKVVDPLFKKGRGRGSSVPIKVTGTARKPEFGLDAGKVLRK